ncbi:hypothetical protein [Dyadobacter frigoris]|uniref:Uncharacterized protein n=1 Tax=Dyadobacter frigoris TaxID=2576211 RepID=A0A4U6CWD2_9BACT|nr:hypothetical protein [Dyadobacter frigoris]TKT88616.1 hypothetical protein FDK13_27105 [Dyadobacter frigoris]GLU54950.1 hypothetical protein Dfri01_44110 [Dyadobacter frigoris]
MKQIKQSYFYLFYWFNNLFKHSADSYNEIKAAFVVMYIQGGLLLRTIIWISNDSILKDYTLVKIIAALIAISLGFSNYHVLVHKKEWKKYEKGFRSMSSNQKILSSVAIIFFLIFFFWVCYFS